MTCRENWCNSPLKSVSVMRAIARATHNLQFAACKLHGHNLSIRIHYCILFQPNVLLAYISQHHKDKPTSNALTPSQTIIPTAFFSPPLQKPNSAEPSPTRMISEPQYHTPLPVPSQHPRSLTYW
ncbi:hypothetical protein P154DRAFT_156703 [Amniculicola lignicola CBS 123094]|uniref:Uncharacterized protein n=1 Tax=Amniculicola lignicola CBS 123094 TaxID=1392246 RepID=A0A6A5WMI7_9PLEO|nr:hypothetical protein P154DRAFT_156703 [Amniculicola lignicola CBS 123094]